MFDGRLTFLASSESLSLWYTPGIPTRNDIISECDNGLMTKLQQNLFNNQPIYFMPNDVSDAIEYVKN
ncbi:13856_t:CDS:2, partial [Gigaspora rosea]